MLFQAVVIFLPILNFFQISCKRGKVHSIVQWFLKVDGAPQQIEEFNIVAHPTSEGPR